MFPPQTLTPTLNTSSSASALLAESNEGLPTRHTVNSSQVNSSPGRLVTKRRSTRHKQTSKPYCQQCIGPPQLLGRSFQKAKKNSQQVVTRMQDFTSEFSKIFPRVIPPEARTLTAGGINDPFPHPTHSPNLGPPQLTPVDQLYSNYCTYLSISCTNRKS